MERSVPCVMALLATLAACTGDRAAEPVVEGAPVGGTVQVRWEDGDTISMALAATGTARWCEAGRWLEVSALQGDTGVMIALFPGDSLVTGSYPVALSVPESLRVRPGATVGVRWFAPGVVAGYRGWQGAVELTDAQNELVSGHLAVDAMPVAGDGTIAVEGTFEQVPLISADSGCRALP